MGPFVYMTMAFGSLKTHNLKMGFKVQVFAVLSITTTITITHVPVERMNGMAHQRCLNEVTGDEIH